MRVKNILRNTALNFARKLPLYRRLFHIPAGSVSINHSSLKDKIAYTSDSRKMTRELPVTIDKEIYWHFLHYADMLEQQTFVASANNWNVWGNQGAVITDNNCLLKEVSREFEKNYSVLEHQFKTIPYQYIDHKVAVLAASGSSNYYHWMFDIIPRIDLLKKAGLYQEVEKFVINISGQHFQKEVLEKAGVNNFQIIPSTQLFNFHIKAKQLLIPSLPSYNGCPSYNACIYLRELFSSEISGKSNNDYIYIQRQKTRRVLNETPLLDLLKEFNFKIIILEELSVAAQAKIFANAKVVIGAHGAGFTNIVFCNPGTTILELFSPQWIMPCYWILANQVNLKYGYLIGEPTNSNEENSSADILVDLLKFKAILSLLKISKKTIDILSDLGA